MQMEFPKKKIAGASLGNGRLLQEIESLSKSLFLNRNPNKPSTHRRSISAGKTHLHRLPDNPKTSAASSSSSSKDRKSSSSIWNWKPFKVLSSHHRSRRFKCCFSLHVHSIESLPSEFNGRALQVGWKSPHCGLDSQPARVFHGIAEFEEALMHTCSVYGVQRGFHHSARYAAMHFLLYVTEMGVPDVDLGRHRIDLARLLPLELEELEEENSSRKWTTSFKLSGKAKGAILNVSFSFFVLGDDGLASKSLDTKLNQDVLIKPVAVLKNGEENFVRLGRFRAPAPHRTYIHSGSVRDANILREVSPNSNLELTSSLTCEEFDCKPELQAFSKDELKSNMDPLLEPVKEIFDNGYEDGEFTVIEKGIEIPENSMVKTEKSQKFNKASENVKWDELDKGRVVAMEEAIYGQDLNDKNGLQAKELLMDELNSVFRRLSILEEDGLEHPTVSGCSENLNHAEVISNYKKVKMGRSLSLDNVTESVAGEFLNTLSIDHSQLSLSSDSDSESPRQCLWKQFKKDFLAGGGGVFGPDIDKEIQSETVNNSVVLFDIDEFLSDLETVYVGKTEHQKLGQAIKSKKGTKLVEDFEMEALMQEWGLNENAFLRSPPNSASGFGSPIDLPSK